MKLILKLAIVAVLGNALYHVGSEYLAFYQFKDQVREAATFRKGSDDVLRSKIEDLAFTYDVPLEDDALRILTDDTKGAEQTQVEVYYVKPIEVFPGYIYPWEFAFAVDTIFSKRY
jgi:hypothetical protein